MKAIRLAVWYIEGRSVGWPSGRLHFADDRAHTLVHVDGRTVTGTQREIVETGALGQQNVSAIINGRRMSANGWMTEASHKAGFKPRLWRPWRAKEGNDGQALAVA